MKRIKLVLAPRRTNHYVDYDRGIYHTGDIPPPPIIPSPDYVEVSDEEYESIVKYCVYHGQYQVMVHPSDLVPILISSQKTTDTMNKYIVIPILIIFVTVVGFSVINSISR